MTSLTCLGIGRLIDQRRCGLDDAERLRLEEHLVQCEDCSVHTATLDGLQGLVDSDPPSLSAQRRGAILDDALAAGASVGRQQRAGLSPRPRLTAAAVTVAVAAAMFIGLRAPQPATQQQASVGDHLVGGALQLDDTALSPGEALPADRMLMSEDGAKLSLGPAHVDLRAGTRVRWQPQQGALELTEGSLLAEVDPSAKARFVVQTPKFQVEVTGTRFWVTLGGVGVERGSVRVMSADGRVLNAHLTAGSRWRLPAEDDVAVEQPLHEQAAEPAEPVESASRRSARRADVGDLLLRARASMAPGRTDGARRLIERALAASPTRPQRAEARTLLAECALVDGKGGKAARIYRDVAERFQTMPAGENALFAAARIQATREQRAQATELLRRYQQRYPNGRFRQEVAARLKALQASH